VCREPLERLGLVTFPGKRVSEWGGLLGAQALLRLSAVLKSRGSEVPG
jgi:hypothetical protein